MTKFITVPNPILRKRSKSVRKIDQKVLKLIEELKKALIEAKEPPGVGLSAVQIGQLLRIFVARKNVQAEPKVYINPRITWQSKEMTNGVPSRENKQSLFSRELENKQSLFSRELENKLEGCLSVPGYYGLIRRAKKIKLKYTTLTKDQRPKTKDQTFFGFLATVIQHEMDHLNGILFIDRVLKQGNKIYKLEKDKLVETVL